jgi:cytochrome c oxidase subunit II
MYLATPKITEAFDSAFFWITAASAILMAGILVCGFVFLIKYHRSRHPEPEKIHGNTKLEIIWTVIPTIIAIWMFWIGWVGWEEMRDPPEDAYVIEAIGRQWSWTFRYPKEDISSPEMYVPVDTPIKVLVSSPDTDVVHSLYLPDFKVKEDCVPGQVGFLWFQAERISVHNIFCAEFCGKDHSAMLSKLHVVSQTDFEAWLDAKLQARYLPVDIATASDPNSDPIQSADAPRLFQTYCASCHGLEGQGGLVEGARDFRIMKGWKRSPKITDIYRTLHEGLEGTQMRSFSNIPPWDRMALAHHVAAFYKGDDRPQSTPEDWKKLNEDYKLDTPPKVTRAFPILDAMKEIAKDAE